MSPRKNKKAIDVWLENEIDSGNHKGLRWIDKKKGTFLIPWMHGSRRQWHIDDVSLFKSWEEYKNRHTEGNEAAIPRCSTNECS